MVQFILMVVWTLLGFVVFAATRGAGAEVLVPVVAVFAVGYLALMRWMVSG